MDLRKTGIYGIQGKSMIMVIGFPLITGRALLQVRVEIFSLLRDNAYLLHRLCMDLG
jgi:hypothetical protein